MRVAAVRSDISKIYLSDVESRTQRNFSSEPPGQSLYLQKPSSETLLSVLNAKAILSVIGTDTNANVNTSSNSAFRIKTSPGSFTVLSVTAGVSVSKETIVADLNTGFLNNGLNVVASITGTNQIRLDTVAPNSGPTAVLRIDTAANGSTLNALIAAAWAASPPNLSGLSVSALSTALYPTATTVDVSDATLDALSTFTSMSTASKADFYAALRDVVAPYLVETGLVLLSFAYGSLSKMRSSSFQPGGARVGLPAGVGVAVVEDDGVTPFTI